METGEDTRIFATEIPEDNLDDNPDNDVAYDSFEVKINYPLPYPQIIEKGQIRNSIDGLTHRSLADICEIEYVKKNGEIINDLDDDGEILLVLYLFYHKSNYLLFLIFYKLFFLGYNCGI
jgi:hypothetical protein